MVFAPIWLHINDFELLRTVPGTEFRCASFPCSKKPPILRISLFFWAQGPWGPGPWSPLGPWGPPFSDFSTFCKMAQDPSGNNRGNSIGNSIGNYIKKLTFKKWHFELNIKWNNLIKGFPGLLNTIGTLLDRSRVILQKVKKSRKWGPHVPQGDHGPGPQGPWAPKKQRNS